MKVFVRMKDEGGRIKEETREEIDEIHSQGLPGAALLSFGSLSSFLLPPSSFI
jgi:hypothetical protein